MILRVAYSGNQVRKGSETLVTAAYSVLSSVHSKRYSYGAVADFVDPLEAFMWGLSPSRTRK